MENETGLDRNAALADMRYTFIEGVVAASVTKCHESREHARSVRFDQILTGRYTAIPTFLAVMFLTFYLTFHVIGQRLSDLLAVGIDALTALVDGALTAYGINPVVHSLIIDGIFAGVGSVLVFLPIIVTLFFFLSILEDTGYMARVAFVMDKPLRRIGLSGRSIVPLLIGFGCSVPAIMATRTVSSDRDRKMTILLTPYMSCSAKISIYAFFTAAFFPQYGALVMIALYLSFSWPPSSSGSCKASIPDSMSWRIALIAYWRSSANGSLPFSPPSASPIGAAPPPSFLALSPRNLSSAPWRSCWAVRPSPGCSLPGPPSAFWSLPCCIPPVWRP